MLKNATLFLQTGTSTCLNLDGIFCSNPADSVSQVGTRAVVEYQARRSTLSITSAILNRVCMLMSSARDLAEDLNVCGILGSASVVTTLLPLVLAHIGPLATSMYRLNL